MRSDLTVSCYRSYEELEGYMDGSAAVIGEPEILDRVVANDYDVFGRRARVPLRRKLGVVTREWARS